MEEYNQFLNKYKFGPDYRTVRQWSIIFRIAKFEFFNETKCGENVKAKHDLKFDKLNDFQKDFVQLVTFYCYPNGNCEENKGYISLMFEEWDLFYEACDMNFTLTLLDSEKSPRFPQSFTVNFTENISSRQKRADAKKTFGLNRYMKRDRLLSSDVFSSKYLFVQCEIQYYPYENFRMPYRMYLNTADEDEMLVIEDLNHPLWKILSEKSPYFKKVLAEAPSRDIPKKERFARKDFKSLSFVEKILADIASKDTPRINLFDSKDFRSLSIMGKSLLKNTDPSFNNIDEVFDLYKFADKVLIEEFKKKCSDYLKIHMTSDVVFDAIVMADMHSDEDLKMFSFQYAVEHWQEAIESKSWTLLRDKDHPDSAAGNWFYFEMFHSNLAKEIIKYKNNIEMSPKENKIEQTETQRLQDFEFYQ